jgi:hypothetical protein
MVPECPIPSLRTVTRLFRVVLDVTSPDFNVEGRRWRPSIIDVFFYFFSALWADEQVNSLLEVIGLTLISRHRKKLDLRLKPGRKHYFQLISRQSLPAGARH